MQHGFCYVPANIYILILLTNTVDAAITVWLTSQKNLNFEHAQYGIVEDVGRGSFLFPTYLGRSKETLFAGYSTPRASWKTLTRTFLVPQPEHSVGLRFQTIPVSLQTSNFPGDCRLPDKGFAYCIHWYLLISLVHIFLKLSDFFVNKFCVFFHMGTIFFKRLLLFFNGHDVDLYIGYFSLKTLHCLVKLIGVRAGGARGAAAPPPFWATQFFGAATKNWAKPVFKDVSIVI